MDPILNGSLVKHVSLGVGKVVAVEPTALHVFFPNEEKRFAAKLRWPAASTFLSNAGVAPDPWLQGLTSFSFDAHTGRYALASNFLSHEEAVAEFVRVHPDGFLGAVAGNGPAALRRASRWRAANAEWNQSFGRGEGERLLAEDELREVTRRALLVGAHVTDLPGLIDAEELAEALEPGDVVKAFFESVFGLINAPASTRPRVERVLASSDALGVDPGLAWTMATLFPFLAAPERNVLLVPKFALAAAARLGCDLKMKPSPTWASWSALRDLSTQLLERLRPSGARDYIDTEVFLHSIATRRPTVTDADSADTTTGAPTPGARRKR